MWRTIFIISSSKKGIFIMLLVSCALCFGIFGIPAYENTTRCLARAGIRLWCLFWHRIGQPPVAALLDRQTPAGPAPRARQPAVAASIGKRKVVCALALQTDVTHPVFRGSETVVKCYVIINNMWYLWTIKLVTFSEK
jgi:hypothetical protein